MKHLSLYLMLTLAACLTACINERPSHIMTQSKMERILYDYHLAQAMAQREQGDVEARQYEYVQAVFRKHGVTEAEFDTSMVWYMGRAEILHPMYVRVNERLEQELNKLGGDATVSMYANLSTQGDTANIWPGDKFLTLSGEPLCNLEEMTIKADTSFHKGDYYKLLFDTRFIQRDQTIDAYCLMQVNYTNDSTYAITQRINDMMQNEVNIPYSDNRKDWRTKEISITLYMSEDDTPSLHIMCITNPILVRYHYVEKPEEAADSISNDSTDATRQTVDSLKATTTTEATTPDAPGNSQESAPRAETMVPETQTPPSMGAPRKIRSANNHKVVPVESRRPDPSKPAVKW